MSESLALPSSLYSPDQLGVVLMELQTHAEQLRDAGVRKRLGRGADKSVATGVEFSPLLAGVLEAAKADPNDAPQLEALATNLEALRRQAPVVHLTFAAMPNAALKQKIAAWFREQIHPAFLLTFGARGDLGGGVVLQTGSHVYDYSFRQRILDNKAKITQGV